VPYYQLYLWHFTTAVEISPTSPPLCRNHYYFSCSGLSCVAHSKSKLYDACPNISNFGQAFNVAVTYVGFIIGK
jgi:hypothetical protein